MLPSLYNQHYMPFLALEVYDLDDNETHFHAILIDDTDDTGHYDHVEIDMDSFIYNGEKVKNISGDNLALCEQEIEGLTNTDFLADNNI